MDSRELVNKIKICYRDKQYQRTIELIEEYLDQDRVGVYPQLLDMYINSLMELGLFEYATRMLEAMNKLFPGYNQSYYTSSMYLKCNEVLKAEKVLLASEKNPDNSFNLGKVYLLEGKYDKARACFMETANKHEEEEFRNKAREQLIKISNYDRLGSYIMRDYRYFKNHGGKLREKDIIYVSKVDHQYNAHRIDSDKVVSHKPYLIWKISGSKIYAIPTSLHPDADYAILAKRYPNIGLNRYANSYMVLIHEEDVCKIYDHLQDEDFAKIQISVYHAMCRGDEESLKDNSIFMDAIMRSFDVKKGDVIRYFDYNNKKYDNYYVLDVTIDSYEVVKISSKFEDYHVLGTKEVIPRNQYVYDVVKIDKEIKDKIESEIKANTNKK